MASRGFAEEDFSCPVCCDIFINPVLLPCSHSVCSSCIQRVWENKTLKECPLCRRTSSIDDPPLNLALRNLCESFQQEKRQRSGSEGETVCSDHKEQLKLFCLDDQQPVCVVCRDSRKHTDHKFCPVDEAIADNKEILKASLEDLQEELRISVDREQNLCKTSEDIKINAERTETQIKEVFKELHQFLHDEEAFRITALREEEEQRSQKMKEKIEETSKQISSLTSTIRDIEEHMKAEDVSFLQNFKATLQRAQFSLPDPVLSPSVTTTFTDHLTNLKLNVLQKIQDNVGEEFSIDHSHFLSLDSVKYNEYKQSGHLQFKKGPLQGVKQLKPQPKFFFRDLQQKEGKEMKRSEKQQEEGKEVRNPLKFTFRDSQQEEKEVRNPLKFTFRDSQQEGKEVRNPLKFTFRDSQQEKKEVRNPLKFTFRDSQQEEKEVRNPLKFTFRDSQQEEKEVRNPLKFTFRDSQQEKKEVRNPLKFTFRDSQQEEKEVRNPLKFTFRDSQQEEGKEVRNPLKFTFRDSQQEKKEVRNPLKFTFRDSQQEEGKEVRNPLKFTFRDSQQEEGKEVRNPLKFTFGDSQQEEGKEVRNSKKKEKK